MALTEWAVAALVVLGVALYGPRIVERLLQSDDERPVMPAHYASPVSTNRTRYPGHCPDCGTDNEPGYRFCESCGSEIPSSDPPRTEADLSQILGE